MSIPGLYILWFTPLWIKDVVIRDGRIHTVEGWIPYFSVTALWCTAGGVMLYRWAKAYFSSRDEVVKRQIMYMFLGMGAYIVSVVTFDVLIPFFFDDTSLFWFSPVTSLPFALIAAFAITKYHLFEVRVVLTELLVALMCMVLVILPFLVKGNQMRILTSVIFLISLIVGYLLIKATHREIRAKEILEQRVQERTKELRESKEEIQKRVEELEKFYKLTVGREMKMIELKRKIKELGRDSQPES